MTNRYKAVIIDMDGTLLNSHKDISKRNKEMVIDIQQRGIKVALASGRPLDLLMEDALKIELDKYHGYLVGNNGQEFYAFEERKVYRKDALPKKAWIDVVRFANKHKLIALGLSQSERIWIQKDDNYEKLLNETKDMIFDKICIKDFPFMEDIENIANELRDLLIDDCQVMISDLTTIELVPFGIDKVVGVNHIRDLNNFKNEEILVIGDGENDYQMACNYPFVAMKDAFDKLKEKAIYITASNDNDGVAKAIERFVI